MENLEQQTIDIHKRIIIHIDMDYFYAQVEEIRNPSLKTKPLGVQQKNFVVTSNYIAREFGVKKLMSVSEAKKLCPEIVLVNGEDLSNYRQMSSKIFEILHKFTPAVEKLGLDENFLDVTELVNQKLYEPDSEMKYTNIEGCVYPPNSNLKSCSCGCSQRLYLGTHLAKEIRNELQTALNITCSAGIAHNKLLAKLVGGMNKPNNQTVLDPTATESFMRELGCLKKITGIGQKTEQLLNECGVMTVMDLQNCDFDILKTKLSYESASKLKELSFGRDATVLRPSGKPKSIGLEDSFKPVSLRKDVEERFRLLLMRLISQVSEDGRIPISVKIIIRKYNAQKKTSHRETKQANILPSLFQLLPDGHILLADGAQEKLLKIIMRLFDRIVDMKKPFNITLLGLAFSKFQVRKFGTSSIASYLMKKTDLEVQSVTCLKSDGTAPAAAAITTTTTTATATSASEIGNEFYLRRKTASPIPMLVDVESIPSDVSDFSETEIEPSPKKSRLGLFIAKRRCLPNCDVGDIASPSKLRVAELRLNSRESEKDSQNSCQSPMIVNRGDGVTLSSSLKDSDMISVKSNDSDMMLPIKSSIILNGNDHENENDEDKSTAAAASSEAATVLTTATTTITGNLANIPCPSGVDPNVFKALPLDVQNELITSWRNSLTVKATTNGAHSTVATAATANATTVATAAGARATNTLHRYFIRNN